MFYTYVLQSVKDGKWYTGSTNDVARRVQEHNAGLVESTRHRRPLGLVYYEACLSEKDARVREGYLKTTWGKRYLKHRLRHHGSQHLRPVERHDLTVEVELR